MTTDDYATISSLNDLIFCPRRCALQRVEGLWRDNVHTAAGILDHRRAHQTRDSDDDHGRTARGLWLVSHRLRIVGIGDLVEFHSDPSGGPDVPFPVEYKRGRRRKWDNDDVQLCAQALCLEEMLDRPVPAGAIFHVKSKRRRDVTFTPALRSMTESAVDRLHTLIAAGVTPPPVVHPKCKECSLRPLCLPDLVAQPDTYVRASRSLFVRPTDSNP